MTAIVIAHRGASGYEVENSLSAFRAAWSMGADAVELDVHGTADGTLVVHHDETLDGKHAIGQQSDAAVRAHRLANGEPVPTLEEALAVVGPRLGAFVEVKGLDPRLDDVLLAALDRGPNPAAYAVHGFDHRIVRRLGRRRAALRRGVLSASYAIHPVAALEDTGASDLWQERHLIDEGLVDAVHAAGARVIAWTVDQPDDMRRLLGMGVDAICTNFPDIGRRVVDGGG
ncbi:MAG: glycerophosphodiester phosphodiesterase [Gemmatimonadales bacterium]